MKTYYYTRLLIVTLTMLILTIVFMKDRLLDGFETQYKKCNYKHLILNDVELDEIAELLHSFIDFTKRNGLNYFAIGGTLIGCVRNGGLLPYDDDIDVGMFEKDVSAIENYKNDKYYFKKMFFGYKFMKKNSLDTFIDVMIFEKKDEMYKIINNMWPNESFNLDELHTFIEKKYSSTDITIPAKYIKYLNRVFPDWDKKIKMDCGHYETRDSKKIEQKCVYEKHGVPKEFDIDFENGKYMCYTDLL